MRKRQVVCLLVVARLMLVARVLLVVKVLLQVPVGLVWVPVRLVYLRV